MEAFNQIKVNSIVIEEGYRIFSMSISDKRSQAEYEIYAFDNDIYLKGNQISTESLKKFAIEQMKLWLKETDGKLPKHKYRILLNGGKITTDNVESFLSIQKKSSDIVRTNVTIAAPLFEWTKGKARKEETSFSDLVSRGLLTLKDSDKEIDVWFREQGAYFRKKLGDFGSFEVFHYLPNNYAEFNTEVMKIALQEAQLKRTGWPIGAYLENSEQRPHPQHDGIRAEYIPTDYLLLDYWYAKNKGEFYFARNLESDSGNGEAEPKTSLYFDTLVWRVAEALEHCLAYYKNLEVDSSERTKIRLSLYNLNNRSLSAWNPMRAFTLRHHISGADISSWEREISLQELTEQLDDVIYDGAKKLLIMFDFFVPNKEVVLDILNKEYRKSKM